MRHGLHDEKILGDGERHAEAAYLRWNRTANGIFFERKCSHRQVDQNAGPLV